MTDALAPPRMAAPEPKVSAVAWLRPAPCFWVAGLILYGLAAANFASGHFLDQISRDLWQHLATLRALIADPYQPLNPFVPTTDGSRHFHPYWVTMALVARTFGWNEWQALAAGGFVSAATLLAGIHAFGRAFYRSPWGPLALLAAMVLSWSFPVSHTGYHSLGTLVEGMGYPAVLLIGLSLLLWAVVLKALSRPVHALLIVPLSAFMLATHQLGAGIGFMVAACFIAFQPDTPFKRRAAVAASLLAGIVLANAWPYHSPLAAIARTGNPTWTGGIDFYSPLMLVTAFVPSALGWLGLRHARFKRRSLPVVFALCLFLAIFASGWWAIPIATRFVMPAVLLLQVGVGALLLTLADEWQSLPKRRQLTLFALAACSIQLQAGISYLYLSVESHQAREHGSAYESAQILTRSMPDTAPVAAYDSAAWPVVATGQRVLSEPWPEPMIDRLAERQAATERLFDPALSREQRLALAEQWDVRTLIIDDRGPIRRPMPRGILDRLDEQSVRRIAHGTLIRYDLR